MPEPVSLSHHQVRLALVQGESNGPLVGDDRVHDIDFQTEL